MKVSTLDPPKEATAAFSHELADFLSGGPAGSVVSEAYVGATPQIPSAADVGMGSGPILGPPTIALALQAFALSLEHAARGTGVFAPAHTGWSFFARGTATSDPVLGSVVRRRHGWRLVSVNYGDVVRDTLDAGLDLIAAPHDIGDLDYELSLLAIPGLNALFLWLSTPNKSDDLIVTPPHAILGLPTTKGGTPVALPNFLADIQTLAAGLLTMPARSGA